MNTLLNFIIKNFDFLYNEFDARFIDSKVHSHNAMLILKLKDIKMMFIFDKGQLFLDFQSTVDKNKNEWFSYDIVHQYITDIVDDTSIMNAEKVRFIKDNFEDICKMFSLDYYKDTKPALKKLEKDRAKRLFG
jgi:hypothetical protein